MAQPVGDPRPIAFADVFPASGTISLVPDALDREANGLYVYKPDPETSEFPLALISPALSTQITSTFGQLRTAPAALEMAPADAAARGIKSGDQVRAWNAHGEVRCVAKVSADVRAGVCVLNKGLWRKHTTNGFTANALIPIGYADLGGQAAFNDARIQVERS
jgi:anaerobic selenocysteine-containing dehydrogenase